MSLKDYIDLRFSQMRPKEYAALEKSGELEEELNRKVKYFEDQAKLLSENPDLQGWQIEEILFHDLFPKSEEQEEEEAQDALEPDPLDEWHQSKMSNYDENGIPLGKRQQPQHPTPPMEDRSNKDLQGGLGAPEVAAEPVAPPPLETPIPEPKFGENNKIFTKNRFEAARERLRKRQSELRAGIDPTDQIPLKGMSLRKIILALAGFALAGILLYPPWIVRYQEAVGWIAVTRQIGHAPLFSPPGIGKELRERTGYSYDDIAEVRLDVAKLLLEIGALVAFAIGLYMFLAILPTKERGKILNRIILFGIAGGVAVIGVREGISWFRSLAPKDWGYLDVFPELGTAASLETVWRDGRLYYRFFLRVGEPEIVEAMKREPRRILTPETVSITLQNSSGFDLCRFEIPGVPPASNQFRQFYFSGQSYFFAAGGNTLKCSRDQYKNAASWFPVIPMNFRDFLQNPQSRSLYSVQRMLSPEQLSRHLGFRVTQEDVDHYLEFKRLKTRGPEVPKETLDIPEEELFKTAPPRSTIPKK